MKIHLSCKTIFLSLRILNWTSLVAKSYEHSLLFQIVHLKMHSTTILVDSVCNSIHRNLGQSILSAMAASPVKSFWSTLHSSPSSAMVYNVVTSSWVMLSTNTSFMAFSRPWGGKINELRCSRFRREVNKIRNRCYILSEIEAQQRTGYTLKYEGASLWNKLNLSV